MRWWVCSWHEAQTPYQRPTMEMPWRHPSMRTWTASVMLPHTDTGTSVWPENSVLSTDADKPPAFSLLATKKKHRNSQLCQHSIILDLSLHLKRDLSLLSCNEMVNHLSLNANWYITSPPVHCVYVWTQCRLNTSHSTVRVTDYVIREEGTGPQKWICVLQFGHKLMFFVLSCSPSSLVLFLPFILSGTCWESYWLSPSKSKRMSCLWRRY